MDKNIAIRTEDDLSIRLDTEHYPPFIDMDHYEVRWEPEEYAVESVSEGRILFRRKKSTDPKTYRVEVPDPNSNSEKNILCLRKRDSDDKVCINKVRKDNFLLSERCMLTEQEIREGYEYLWPFAEEVRR